MSSLIRISPGAACFSSRFATARAGPLRRASVPPSITSPVASPKPTSNSTSQPSLSSRFRPVSPDCAAAAARTARIASSSCTRGTPKMPMTASPVNRSTTAPCRSRAPRRTPRHRETAERNASGSISVPPMGSMSASTTVTVLRRSPTNSAGKTGASSWLAAQGGVVLEDRSLQLLERRARIDPQLVAEHPASVLIRAERICLATRAVQRDHELAAESLAKRMVDDERAEFADENVLASQSEIGLDPILDRNHVELFEACDRRLGERLVREVRQRRPTPQRECLAQPVGRLLRRADRFRQQLLEPGRVQLTCRDLQRVARRARLHDGVAECLAQSRDGVVQGGDRGFRWIVAPELVDEAVRGHDLVRVHEQNREQLPLAHRLQRDRKSMVDRLERPQNAEFKAQTSLCSTCYRQAGWNLQAKQDTADAGLGEGRTMPSAPRRAGRRRARGRSRASGSRRRRTSRSSSSRTSCSSCGTRASSAASAEPRAATGSRGRPRRSRSPT